MKVRILHLVDNPERSRTVETALRTKLSLVYDPVQTERDYIEALQHHRYDLVLASASCSTYSGPQALSHLRRLHPEVPFVFLTTPREKNTLLDMASLDVWDIISTSEIKRLPLSVAHAIDAASCSSELEKAKSLLLRSQRSITVGRLLGSIAHEINNPLEAIANLLYLAQRGQSSGEAAPNWVKMAEQELERVGDITKQTLTFHRDSKNAEEFYVTEALESVLVLYRTRLEQRKIEVVRQYRFAGLLVAHPGELRQVFANLVSNAVDATPKGGRLTLRTRQQRSSNPKLYITIADTGTGMSREASRRMGELFYTTKGESGTGLGMWVSQQLIKKYGGSLKAFSSTRPGNSGTVFRLCFAAPHEGSRHASGSGPQTTMLQPRAREKQDRHDGHTEAGEQAKSA